jgi:putative ABC transport system permease protein
MRLGEVLRLSVETILTNKFRSLLTMLGMVIGVFSVVTLVSLGQGAKNYVLSEFQSLGTNMIIIQPGKTEEKGAFHAPIGSAERRMTLRDVEALQKRSLNIEAVSGLVLATAEIRNGTNTSNNNVLGVNERFNEILNFQVQNGEFLSAEESVAGRRVVVLGNELSQTLFGNDYAVGRSVQINRSDFRVIGVLHRLGNKLGLDVDLLAFIPTTSSLRLFNEDRLFGIRAKASARSSVSDAVAEIKEILTERRRGEEDFTVVTQVSMMSSLGNILQVLSYLLGGIAAISMLVGGVGIMNIMLVSVTERIPEIGIRRAVGARRIDILQQFLMEALMLSVFSGLLGIGASLLLIQGLYYFYPVVDLTPSLFVLGGAFLLSALIGVLFGVWPAYRAAKVETLEALRYE